MRILVYNLILIITSLFMSNLVYGSDNINYNGYSFISKDNLGPVSKKKDKKEITRISNQDQKNNQSQLESQEKTELSTMINHTNIKTEDSNNQIKSDPKIVNNKTDEKDKIKTKTKTNTNTKNKIQSHINTKIKSKPELSSNSNFQTNSNLASKYKGVSVISIKAKPRYPSLLFHEDPMRISVRYLNSK